MPSYCQLQFLWAVTVFGQFVLCENVTSDVFHDQRLFDHLEATLPRHSPPSDISNNKTVTVELIVEQILNVDEKQGIWGLKLFVNYDYFSPSVAWNSSEFGGKDRLQVPRRDFWMPDFG